MRPDLNIVQPGAINHVWDRVTEQLQEHLVGTKVATAFPMQDAARYFILCATAAGAATPAQIKDAVVLVCHFEQSPGRSLQEALPALRACRGVLCMNKAAQKELAAQKVAAEVVTFGVDLDAFRPGLRAVDNDRFVIGVCGANHPTGRKGPGRIVEVAKVLREIHEKAPVHAPTPKWIFCGRGWQPVVEVLTRMDVDAEEWSAWKRYDTYPQFYHQLDALLIASDVEGGPYPLLEALASGVRVVSTPCGWVPDIAPRVVGVTMYPHARPDYGAQLLYTASTEPRRATEIRASMFWATWTNFLETAGRMLGLPLKGDDSGQDHA